MVTAHEFDPDKQLDPTCYACGKPIRFLQRVFWIQTSDGQDQYVGPDCYTHIANGGKHGYQPPLGGPRLFLKHLHRPPLQQ